MKRLDLFEGKKALWLCATAIALSVLAGCASGPRPSVLLDWKGSSLGVQVPEWVKPGIGSAVAVEALEEYKDQYCFVITNRSNDDLTFLMEWIKRVEGQTEIANFISTTVTDEVQREMKNKEGLDPDADKRAVSEISSTFANASYTAARRVSDFWTLSRNKATKQEYYEAYALFIIDKDILNTQIARNLENIITKNQELSAAEIEVYRDLIDEIRGHGLRG